MNKDVIYIDVEDDITAIISKVKSSKDKIVALVPPKRVGVLQSAVNLRLLARAAEQNSKRLVIITNNHALMSLAAAANLPVAKNLQSKPEIAPVAALEVDDGEDVIDGNSLPVGEHAGLKDDERDEAAAAIAAAPVLGSSDLAQPPKPGESLRKPKSKKGGVPNFNTFRKKLILGIVAALLLIAFLMWAIFFAPRATVVVSAKTTDSSVNANVTAAENVDSNTDENTIKATSAKETEEKSVEFQATGRKNVGDKASGTVEFSTNSISALGTTIPAGTRLSSSSGMVFVTNSTVTMSLENSSGAPTGITASEQGAKYNGASGSMSGAPSGVSAEITDSSSGGTDKIARVVTESDIQKAKQSLVEEESDVIKNKLKEEFNDDATVIDESFRTNYARVESKPTVGQEASGGNATLNATVTYVLYAIEKSELDKYLDGYLKKEIGERDDQRVYDNGGEEIQLEDVEKSDNGARFTLIATGKIGPKLDESRIKEEAKGRRFGDIQQSIQSIQGVEDVDVNFFPFWVNSVPNDLNKINVQFKVDDES